jgi:hypothetical protein
MPSSNLTFLVLCKPSVHMADNTELATYYNENKNTMGRVGDNVFVFDSIRGYDVLDGFRQHLKRLQAEFFEFEVRAGDTDYFVRGGFNKETMEFLAKHALNVSNIFRDQ